MTTRILLLLTAFMVLPLHAGNTNLTIAIGYSTTDFRAAKAAGFDFVELRVREFMKLSDGDFDKFASDCRSNGLPVTAANYFLPAGLKVTGPDVNLNAVTNYFEKSLDRCQRLGVKIIAWGSGDSRRVPAGFPEEKAFEQLVMLGKFLAPEAQKRGIIVVAEPLRKAECNIINSAADGLKWVEAVGHPNFQLLVDNFHMTEEKEDMTDIVKAGAHIAHIHMSNPKGRAFPMDAGEFDYAPFFKALNQIGYHGTISIEASTGDLAREGPKAIQFIRNAYSEAGK